MKYIRWDEYYAVAEDLHKKIGTINVPANYIYKGYPIGEWISRQRGIERKNGLKSVRKKKLEKLNIVWDGRKVNEEKRHADFLLMYSILKKNYDTYGNTHVPRSFIMDGYKLGSWTSSVRESLNGKRKIRITEGERKLLEEIGFETDWYHKKILASWDEYFGLVTEYAEIYGIERIIQSTIYKNKRIGNWIHSQRVAYKSGKLSQNRYTKLLKIGVNFTPSSGKWEKAFSIAKKYHDEFHDLDIPADFVMDGFNIGAWISNQRQVYNGSRTDISLTSEQIKKLEAIDMRWKSNAGSQTSFLELAFLYYIKKIYSDAKARDKSYGVELDIYIPSQKTAIEYDGSYWHNRKMERDDFKDDVCTNHGLKLIRIREHPLPKTKSAICYFSESRYTDKSLDALIKRVLREQFFRNVDIDVSRDAFYIIQETQSLQRTSWDKMYNEAKCYYQVYGNLLIPAAYISKSGARLGKWIQNQRASVKRTAYGHLTPNQIKLLDSIGMVWDVKEKIWEDRYRIAQLYYQEFGNLLVPRNLVYHNVKLGKWINEQRNSHNGVGRKKMPDKRCKKLEKIGMVWNTRLNTI